MITFVVDGEDHGVFESGYRQLGVKFCHVHALVTQTMNDLETDVNASAREDRYHLLKLF